MAMSKSGKSDCMGQRYEPNDGMMKNEEKTGENMRKSIKIGKFKLKLKHPEISVASVMAGMISWACNKSILWMVFHYFCGLFYLLYWLMFHECTMPNVFDYYTQLITGK